MQNEKNSSGTMLEEILSMPSNEEMIAQGRLPHGSLLNLETALTYARMALKEKSNAKTEEYIGVVIEHLEAIKERVEKAKKDAGKK